MPEARDIQKECWRNGNIAKNDKWKFKSVENWRRNQYGFQRYGEGDTFLGPKSGVNVYNISSTYNSNFTAAHICCYIICCNIWAKKNRPGVARDDQ